MGSINFNQPLFADSKKTYVYADLHLDLQEEKILNKRNNNITVTKSDIKVSYNLAAIKNSLYNLFTTKKGQRPLNPGWGLSLEQYLFEPISAEVAYKIGTDIEEQLKTDTRFTASKINVFVQPDEGYNIELAIYVPYLSIDTVLYLSVNTQNGVTMK